MGGRRYAVAIVGSGPGGATVARELSRRGKDVVVIERGRPAQRLGTVRDFLCINAAVQSREGVGFGRVFTAGGTAVVCSANGVRCLEAELAGYGIDLASEFAEAEREMGIAPLDERLLSEGTHQIRHAAHALGYAMDPMPKFIDPDRCVGCGMCPYGCAFGAKWTPLAYLREAEHAGAEIQYDATVTAIAFAQGRATGVKGTGPLGEFEIRAEAVILAAGGLETPVLLQKSGIRHAGMNLTLDPVVNTYGITKNLHQLHEPSMALLNSEFLASKGFILSPWIPPDKLCRFCDIGLKGLLLPPKRMLGIMTKIADEPAGRVYPDGTISKSLTAHDRHRLREGSSLAAEILVKAGVDKKSILYSRKPGGTHPAGTAAIGTVVDMDLQTSLDNLFACDASVLPSAPGAPPVLTIVALAKRLGKLL